MYTEQDLPVKQTIQNYFEGVYYGDVQKLRSSFIGSAYLYGDIKGEEYSKHLFDYLDGVNKRESPHDLGESFNMKILSIEVMGNVAIAKLHVPMLGYNYYDYLSLSLVENEWKIVNKLFTHVE